MADESGPGKALPIAEMAAAVTVLLGALTGLAVSGLLQRAQINHGHALTIALALVVGAACVWLVAAIGGSGGQPEQSDDPAAPARQAKHERNLKRLRMFALGLAGAGLVVGFLTVILTQSDAEIPSIEATYDADASILKAKVEVSDISSKEYLAVRIEGVVGGDAVRALYRASFGPDVEGDISKEISVEVPPDEFEQVGIKAFTSKQEQTCSYARAFTDPGQGAGCVIIALRPTPSRPTVRLGFDRRRATLRVVAENLRHSAVAVRVVGLIQSGRRRLASLLQEPDAAGQVAIVLRVPIDAAVRRVCVEAKLAKRLPWRRVPCPVKLQKDSTATYLDVIRPRSP